MNIPIIPGRGLVTQTATDLRLNFLSENNIETNLVSNSQLELYDIKNNIESYIGSTEIPLGVIGPLVYDKGQNGKEIVYGAAGTLEGALIASINRGAKILSKSGGFSAKVKWQKMTRSPMFIFETTDEATTFKNYVDKNFNELKKVTESYSNHATLLEIEEIQHNNIVHLKFIYSSGDASGQNMTTTCTWHAMLYAVESFKAEANFTPLNYVIEGNGACDKKVSHYNINSGRGIHVTAECNIDESTIQNVLRTTSDKLISCYNASKILAKKDGMIGYNINVANVIAAMFVATGQDLASIHESSVGILNLNKTPKGLHVQLTLPNLVIGTIGGGTGLPKQKQVLKIMDCYGSGKVNRFAKLIAGFALGLELSTFAAIVSGEFAKAHEKLGRNKPTDWLLPSEIQPSFIKPSLNGFYKDKTIKHIEIKSLKDIENGILTNIASKVNKKVTGFIPVKVDYINSNNELGCNDILIKSKPLDKDVIKGLHRLAASINPELSDALRQNSKNLEYNNCHFKEVEIYDYLHKIKYPNSPYLYGKQINANREIYMLFIDFLDKNSMKIMNSENQPELWKSYQIIEVIKSITTFHQTIKINDFKYIEEFKPLKSKTLYKKLMSILISECADDCNVLELKNLYNQIDDLAIIESKITLDKTIIHNDFNSRNIAVNTDGKPIIYDWELSVIDYPHRDIVEFLSFVLCIDFKKETLLYYLKEHFKLYPKASWQEFVKVYKYSLQVYIITRLSFYEVSSIIVKYEFSNRVLNVALKMLKYLNEDE